MKDGLGSENHKGEIPVNSDAKPLLGELIAIHVPAMEGDIVTWSSRFRSGGDIGWSCRQLLGLKSLPVEPGLPVGCLLLRV